MYTEGVTVWIDFDQDFVFEVGEIILQVGPNTTSPQTGTFTVPVGAALGNTRMRVVMDDAIVVTDPCINPNFGEVEDYTVNIIANVPQPVVEVLGRLRYRYSFSQNVLRHSVEVANFMAMIAGELGLDVHKAKRMGLFHDIGKALDHDKEGSHALIGMEFLKRHGEDPEVLNGVGCHHFEIPAESSLAALVNVCDTLSASRPGGRSETTEIYLKRLEQLEEIGYSFDGVNNCYAVQAGREVRVFVEPDKVSEDAAYALSRDIA